VPGEVSSFVGRRRELDEIKRLLAASRRVTLTGIGGIGKTRLAVRVAGDARRAFGGAVWLVDLTQLREPDMLAALVLDALGLGQEAGETPVRQLTSFLAAPDDAVALFAARAQAASPDFVLTEDNRGAVARLCRRLDGLPLAIELAAARVRVLTPQQILDRSADRFAMLTRGAPARQRTLRACVEWSFDLSTGPEQRLWARLSVFAGGFHLDAVEGVCADGALPGADLLGLLAGLVDKSVVSRADLGDDGDQARYRMLETIADYGGELLAAPGPWCTPGTWASGTPTPTPRCPCWRRGRSCGGSACSPGSGATSGKPTTAYGPACASRAMPARRTASSPWPRSTCSPASPPTGAGTSRRPPCSAPSTPCSPTWTDHPSPC
jgi:predicted ATPase